MKPSEVLSLHRSEIREIVARNDACNPRVFGSTVRGEDAEGSDLDLLVDPIQGKTTLLSLVSIESELATLLGIQVDVQTPLALSERIRVDVMLEAVPL